MKIYQVIAESRTQLQNKLEHIRWRTIANPHALEGI